jgi:hypothetical protein
LPPKKFEAWLVTQYRRFRFVLGANRDHSRGELEMAGKNTAVFGIYPTCVGVESGIDALQAAGFRSTDISALFPENAGSKDFAHEKGTKAPEGAMKGAGGGAVVGAALGWLAGIGGLAIPGVGPGVGPFVVAGPIMSALAGAAVGGALGTIAGALVGMGVPEFEAKRYEGRVKAGGILLSVHCDSSAWRRSAKRILKQTGAHDVCSTGEARADYAKSDKPLSRSATAGKSA